MWPSAVVEQLAHDLMLVGSNPAKRVKQVYKK